MLNDIKEIYHHRDQRFNVDVKLENAKFYSGKLLINKAGAFLEVYGEVIGNEPIIGFDHFSGQKIDKLECISREYIFHLIDLTLTSFYQRTIRHSKGRESFQIEFSVKYFYLCYSDPSSYYRTDILFIDTNLFPIN